MCTQLKDEKIYHAVVQFTLDNSAFEQAQISNELHKQSISAYTSDVVGLIKAYLVNFNNNCSHLRNLSQSKGSYSAKTISKL